MINDKVMINVDVTIFSYPSMADTVQNLWKEHFSIMDTCECLVK